MFAKGEGSELEIRLPPPVQRGSMSVEEAIARRRSVRSYARGSLHLSQLSQLLWAAQGITGSGGLRAAPSAGATYPLEVYVAVASGGVEGIEGGVYRYNVERHSLSRHLEEDLRGELSLAALEQEFIAEAPLNIVICARYQRTAWRYGRRAERYVHMEAGHVGQSIHLQAEALGLATVMVGAFYDDEVSRAMALDREVTPLYIIPVGKAR
jgi:SagB-type dehydrogenase family enzyme